MGAPVADLGERLGAGVAPGHLEAVVAQSHRDHVDDARLVVDHEHAQPFGVLRHGRMIDAQSSG